MPGRWIVAIGILAVLVWAGAAIGADTPENTFEVYAYGFADSRAAEETARVLAGPEGKVVLDAPNHRLLVVTTAERHAQIAEAMRKMDVPPRNVRIDVEFRGAGAGSSAGASLDTSGEMVREEGLTHTMIRMQPRIQGGSSTFSSRVAQTLLVASGREGSLRVGESVPRLEWLMEYGLNWGVLQQRVVWQRVGASMVVQPVVVGEGPMVRIRITPELSGLVDGNPYRVRFSRVSTEVVAQDGQTFQIGGAETDRQFYEQFLIGVDFRGVQQTMGIFLTPHIMSAPR